MQTFVAEKKRRETEKKKLVCVSFVSLLWGHVVEEKEGREAARCVLVAVVAAREKQ